MESASRSGASGRSAIRVVACLMFVSACSAGSSGPGSSGTAGTAAGGSPGTGGSGGSSAGSGGSAGSGNAGAGGSATGNGGRGGDGEAGAGDAGHAGTGGGAGAGGGAGGAGAAGRGGTTGGGGAGAAGSGAGGGAGSAGNSGAAGRGGTTGGAGAGGSAGASGAGGGTTTFACNQVTAMTLTREWFEAGFQTNPGIVDGRWQLKAREHGYITEWANPSSDFWNEPIESPCTNGSTNPDHVVLTVLSWVPACCTTQAQWDTQITAAINTFKAKYAALKRIDLMTVIRGPGNMLCPTPPASGETIVIPPELDAALAAAATKFPGLVFVAPKFEAPNCAAFSGGGPHLTTAGNTAVAKMISAAFGNLQ